MSAARGDADPWSGCLVVVAPHMDDESIGCGQLLAKREDKLTTHVVYATDGARLPEAGFPGSESDSSRLAETRRREALNAMSVLGIPEQNAHFMAYPDGELKQHLERFRGELLELLSKLQPASICVPFRYDRHPDHLAVNMAVCGARAGGLIDAEIFEYFVYNQWRLLRTGDVRDYVPPEQTVRLTKTSGPDLKRKAIECHRSQTTLYFDGQKRPTLSEELIDRVCRSPEVLLRFDPRRPSRHGLARGRRWVPVAHRLEPVLKRWKDRFIG